MQNLTRNVRFIVVASAVLVLSSGAAFAGSCGPDHDHNGGGSVSTRQGMPHRMPMMMNRPAQSVEADGVKISVDVMDMAMHKHMQEMKQNPLPGAFDSGKSHAIMVMLTNLKTKETLSGSEVTVTLVSPSGRTETGKAVWSGDHYGESFTPSEKGAYKIRIKTVDKGGKERQAEFKYEKA